MAKRPTFAQVKSSLLDGLAIHGWKVVSGLKVPHATSPDGGVRLWFKSQAIYVGTNTNLGDARSLTSDMRDVQSIEQLVASAKSYVGRVAGHSGLRAVRVQKQAGGQILFSLGNRAATYSPHSGFTVFGFLDGNELRVAHGKPGKHYANAKTAETAIYRWLHESAGRAAGQGKARRARTARARKQRQILIDRKGYQRRAYFRKDGTRVKAATVAPSRFLQIDPGKPGRRSRGSKKGPHRNEPKWIQRPGMLGGPGYTKRPWAERKALLESSLEESGRKSTILRLQVLMRPVALKPETRKVLTHDLNWLEAHTLGWGK